LEAKGFGRVILSKNVSLNEIREISAGSNLGIEYFVHGDLCISHTGQCFMSSLVSGDSGNRGKCRKPCRSEYELQGFKDARYEGHQHFLAHKDLCLYPYLPQMVDAGISSFKIEGRMRSADILAHLVSIYRRALDRLIDDPASYQTDERELQDLHEHRIRDYTAGNLIEPLDRNAIGLDGLREPIPATAPELITRLEYTAPIEIIPLVLSAIPQLTVRVGGLEGLLGIGGLGADNIILGYDQIRQNGSDWSQAEINEAYDMLKNSGARLFLETPRIVSQNDLPAIRKIKNISESARIDGIVVNDLGSLNIFKDTGLEIWGGQGLNALNRNAAYFLRDLGVSRVTASLEIGPNELEMMLNSGVPTELMVHGPLPCMVTDFCIIQAAQGEMHEECSRDCLRGEYALVDRGGQRYPIVTDNNCRNHLLLPYDLCLLSFLRQFCAWGVRSLRIDGQCYKAEKVAEIVTCYREGLEQIKEDQWDPLANYSKLIDLFPAGLTAALFASSRPKF
jgi:putative protease